MEEIKETDGLYIPVNIRRRKEIIEGFGKHELVKSIIWFFIGAAIGLILFLSKEKNPIYIVVSITFFTGSSFVLQRKDKTNRSPLDYLKNNYTFNTSRKRFDYKYKNIYEKTKED